MRQGLVAIFGIVSIVSVVVGGVATVLSLDLPWYAHAVVFGVFGFYTAIRLTD